MRAWLFSLMLALTALSPTFVQAQSATINSPVSEAKLVVEQINITRGAGGQIQVSVQTSTDQTKRLLHFDVAASELTSLVAAMMTVRSGETGGNARKLNFRVLGWLADNNKIVDSDGAPIAVTLVP